MIVLTLADYLSFLYLCLVLWCTRDIFTIINNGHDFYSYHMGFLILADFWSLFRFILLFRGSDNWPIFILSTLFWIPFSIQFGTYSLLCTFYIKDTHKIEWENEGLKKKTAIIYSFANSLMLIICVILILLESGAIYQSPVWNRWIKPSFSMLLYTILICALLYFGRNDKPSGVNLKPVEENKISMYRILVAICIIFGTRIVYNMLAMIDPKEFSTHENYSKLGKGFGWFQITAFIVWEVVPIIVLLGYFHRIPKSSVPKTHSKERQNLRPTLPKTDSWRKIPTTKNTRNQNNGLNITPDESPRVWTPLLGSKNPKNIRYDHIYSENNINTISSISPNNSPLHITKGSPRRHRLASQDHIFRGALADAVGDQRHSPKKVHK